MRKALILLALLAVTALAAGPTLADFQKEVAAAGMTFKMPAGYAEVPQAEDQFSFVIRSADKKVEIRYVINNLADDVEQYKKSKQPNSGVSAVDPNVIFKSIIMVAAANISGNPPDPDGAKHFPKDAVKSEFGADDGMTTAVRIADKEFSSDYAICLVNIIQKDNVAYGITYALANQPDDFKAQFYRDDAFHALRFK